MSPHRRSLWVALAVAVAALLYLSTVQTIINGGGHPYVTDVGEHQNALPRWGTIHHSGYPQWTALGSLFVSALRVVGMAPAAGVSLYSLAWGLLTVALLVLLAMELGASGPWAALGALTAAVSTSVWMDASIGELHTATMALTLATLLFAVRFGRDGRRADLLWLTFVFSQGVVHQRSLVLIAPAVLLLVLPHLLNVFRMGWRTWLLLVAIALLAPLTYLYLPLRVWMGADWVFGAPGTWDGFWTLFFDNRADRVFDLSTDWAARLRTTAGGGAGRVVVSQAGKSLTPRGQECQAGKLWGLAFLASWRKPSSSRRPGPDAGLAAQLHRDRAHLAQPRHGRAAGGQVAGGVAGGGGGGACSRFPVALGQ